MSPFTSRSKCAHGFVFGPKFPNSTLASPDQISRMQGGIFPLSDWGCSLAENNVFLLSLSCRAPFISMPQPNFFTTVPHTTDHFSVDLPEPFDLSQYHSSGSSISTGDPKETNPGWFDCDQRPASTSASETRDGELFDVREVDRLQPRDVCGQLKATLPENLLRYHPKTQLSTDPATFTVKAVQTDFDSESLPAGWEAMNQFEGQVFFYHKEKNIITETWLYNPEWQEEINNYIQLVDDLRAGNQTQIPSSSALVLEIRRDADSGEIYCAYYLAHPETQCIFWLEEFCLDRYLTEVKGGQLAEAHIEMFLHEQYWKHFEYFEKIHKTPTTVLRELRETLLNSLAGALDPFGRDLIVTCNTDTITCQLSTVNHTEKELGVMIGIVEGAKKDLDEGGRGCPLSVGKFMSGICHERFLNHYGQQSARLCRDRTIYDVPPRQDRRSWAISFLSPILFYVPDVHLHSLDKIWVDEIAAKEPWRAFTERLTSEWAEQTAFATILLNANVAFLGVPGVESVGPSQPLTQLFSSISLVMSIGTAILGLMLVRQNRTKRIGTAEEAVRFILKNTPCLTLYQVDFFTTRDLETTAILFSLPYALLMYGMAFFLAAFLSSCFLWTSITMRLTVGVFCAITSLLVLWCLVWQVSEDSTAVPSWFARLKSVITRSRYGSSESCYGDDFGEVEAEEEKSGFRSDNKSTPSVLHNTAEMV
ncbi:hypothetical protein B0H19DRAFT_42874 [Mycena capillaripes]|nr:hypothetical protein B0H19DRAFT_42874 [Mycena capillaripes]